MVRCPGLSLRAQVKGNSFVYFEHDPWVLSLETKGKLDQKIFVTVQSPVPFNPSIIEGFPEKKGVNCVSLMVIFGAGGQVLCLRDNFTSMKGQLI